MSRPGDGTARALKPELMIVPAFYERCSLFALADGPYCHHMLTLSSARSMAEQASCTGATPQRARRLGSTCHQNLLCRGASAAMAARLVQTLAADRRARGTARPSQAWRSMPRPGAPIEAPGEDRCGSSSVILPPRQRHSPSSTSPMPISARRSIGRAARTHCHACARALITSYVPTRRSSNAPPLWRQVRALTTSDAAVDAVDWAGCTPLHWAVLVDASESTAELLAAGELAAMP